jgi:hypothetical protein
MMEANESEKRKLELKIACLECENCKLKELIPLKEQLKSMSFQKLISIAKDKYGIMSFEHYGINCKSDLIATILMEQSDLNKI